MRYFVANFIEMLPVIDGLTYLATMDYYQFFSATDEALATDPFKDVRHAEITEFQAMTCRLFYGESRPHRSAYSDREGLEPDADQLAKGKRKTKVYFTDEITEGTLDLMKIVTFLMIQDEYDTRISREAESELINQVNQIGSIHELNVWKEHHLGIEMSKTDAQKLGLWHDDRNTRHDHSPVNYDIGF